MKTAYEALKKIVNRSGFGAESHPLIKNLVEASEQELSRCTRLQLVSKVANKSYFAFEGAKRRSRPVNADLFDARHGSALDVFLEILQGNRWKFAHGEITRSIYSVAMICCAGRDVASDGDKKTPGTIFE